MTAHEDAYEQGKQLLEDIESAFNDIYPGLGTLYREAVDQHRGLGGDFNASLVEASFNAERYSDVLNFSMTWSKTSMGQRFWTTVSDGLRIHRLNNASFRDWLLVRLPYFSVAHSRLIEISNSNLATAEALLL